MDARQPERRYVALSAHLEALASPTRLELLHALRSPRRLNEIRAQPSLSRLDESPERPLSRQGIQRHLETLIDAGLVLRIADEAEPAERFVLAHERLFAMVDEIRVLAKLRRTPSSDAAGPTMEREGHVRVALAARPRLVVAYGRDDGVAYALTTQAGARWRIGRGATCEIRLDYDPFASAEHCVIERNADSFTLTDPDSRNGTLVNWEEIPRGRLRKLLSGDLIGVGRSVLALQE